MLEYINLANLDENYRPIVALHIDYGRLNQCVVGLTISSIYL